MNICHLYDYEHQAITGAREYAKKHCNNINRVMFNSNLRIWTDDGNIHYFMGEYRYSQWCKGRTYMLNEAMMHSGYPVKS